MTSSPKTEMTDAAEDRDGKPGRRTDSQLEHGGAFSQHHLHKVPVVDGVAVAARHLTHHLLQLQVGLGDPQLLHHELESHHVCRWRERE